MHQRKTLTTELKLNVDLMEKFGPHGDTIHPIDLTPFVQLEIPDDSRWKKSSIIDLPVNTVLNWDLSGFSSYKMIRTKVVFKLIGLYDTTSIQQEWYKIFNNPEAYIQNDTLVIQDDGTELNTLEISTCKDITSPFNLTYSIYIQFMDNKDGSYFFKLDPLIKNNSNGPGLP